MATYEYTCCDCGAQFEKRLSYAEYAGRPRMPCPTCDSTNTRRDIRTPPALSCGAPSPARTPPPVAAKFSSVLPPATFRGITFVGSADAKANGVSCIFAEGGDIRLENVGIQNFDVGVAVGAGRSGSADDAEFVNNNTDVKVRGAGKFKGTRIKTR